MNHRSARIATCVLLLSMVSCTDDDTPSAPDGPIPSRLCNPSGPESLLCNLAALYNDQEREVSDRLWLYEDLFSRDYTFRFRTPIEEPGSWGVDSEVEAHRGIFTAQDDMEIVLLTLSMAYGPAEDLDPPHPDRKGWKEILVSHVDLRLMFSSNDGLEVNGGQAEFLFPPPVGGRWTIGEWRDLDPPAPGLIAVEPTTWATIKAIYLP